MRRAVCRLMLVLGLGFTADAVFAERTLQGRTGGGAYFSIVVPDAWNGELVIWNHGLQTSPIAPNPDLGPLAGLHLSQGYAVAASTLSQIGWSLFKSNRDLEGMYRRFVHEFGRPNQVFLYGGSLGGLVTAAAVERARLGNVVGAFPFCGVVGGSRNWDIGLDLRLIYDAVCSGVPGAFIPGGAEGLPKGSTLTTNQILGAVNACTGVLQPPATRTPEQRARLGQILDEIKLPESFLANDMIFATRVMSDLVHDPKKLRGKIGTGNHRVMYEDPFIDFNIERVRPRFISKLWLRWNFTPRGRVGNTKIVSMHTDKDGLAVVENESEYAAVVPPSNLTTAIVVEDTPSHCGFEVPELTAGWESLRGWVAGGPQPSAASIQATCLFVATQTGGECRIDPNFVISDMDDRVPPRRR